MRAITSIGVGLSLLITLQQGTLSVKAQGAVHFSNLSRPELDARVTFLDGTPVDYSFGFVAELWGGAAGTPVEQLQPLTPTTTFRPRNAAGYILAVTIRVPGVQVNEDATLVMRVYKGTGWEASTCRGESNPIILTLGPNEGGVPPPDPLGLQPFSVNCIPEPSAFALLVSGTIALVAVRRGVKASRCSLDGQGKT